ncbi:MAG TPA: amidase family protein [Acidimicrobiales bacterium]|nr:amidase family protein [Acidimicrobiales bacterium]
MNDPSEQTSHLAALSVEEITRRFADGSLTSLSLVDNFLERIAALDEHDTPIALSSIAALCADARGVAIERDGERSSGNVRGELHGVPVLIKDNIEAVGLPGVAGSTSLLGRASRDATLVTRLRDAGLIILGSTNLSEWANIRSPRSTSGYSATGGLVANPWALDRSAGGSSSGSGAALAAGLAPLAVGTETDGSIVCPASVNGVVGLKPTVGTVPTTYVVPISSSQDSPGPMGRNVNDVALIYSVLARSSAPDVGEAPRVVTASNWRTGHPQTDEFFDDVVSSIRLDGLVVTDRDLALPGESEGRDEEAVLFAELYDDLSAYLVERPGSGVASLEDVIAFEDENHEREQRYFGHENFLAAVKSGGRNGPDYADARKRNLAWAVETCLTPGLDGFDLVIAPAFGPSWKSDLSVGGHPGPASPATMAPAIAGWPIMCLPIGLIQGLPVGLAIIGRPHSEWVMIDAARRIEKTIHHRGSLPAPLWRLPSRG